jgi:hypothetical protein
MRLAPRNRFLQNVKIFKFTLNVSDLPHLNHPYLIQTNMSKPNIPEAFPS